MANRGWDDPDNSQDVLDPADGIAAVAAWLMLTCDTDRTPALTKYATNTLGALLRLAQWDTVDTTTQPIGTTQANAADLSAPHTMVTNTSAFADTAGLQIAAGMKEVRVGLLSGVGAASYKLYPPLGLQITSAGTNVPIAVPDGSWFLLTLDAATNNYVLTQNGTYAA